MDTAVVPVSASPSATPPWRSESIDLLAVALVKAQAEIEDAPRSGNNKFKGYTYATISDIRAATKAPLAHHGLAITQLPFTSPDGHSIRLRSILIHTSGQWIASELEARCEGMDRERAGVLDMQKVGSALTYMRKYALSAMTGVAVDDDDGQATASEGQDHAPPPQQYRRNDRQPQRQLEQSRRQGSRGEIGRSQPHSQGGRDDRRNRDSADSRRSGSAGSDQAHAQAHAQAEVAPWEEGQVHPDERTIPLPDVRDWLGEWMKFANEWWIDQFDKRDAKPPEGYPTLVNQYQLVRHLYKWASAEGLTNPDKAMPERPSNTQIERAITDVFDLHYAAFDAELEHYIKHARPAQIKAEIAKRKAGEKKAG